MTCAGTGACQSVAITCGEGVCQLSCGSGNQVCASAEFACGKNTGEVACQGPQNPPTLVLDAGSLCDCQATNCG